MNKEYLEKLKQKLSELSEEEQKQRDLYLRQIATGEMYGPNTGYASIDKPWLKYYTEQQINSIIEQKTCYQALVESVKKNKDKIAIEYFGRKITYKELLEEVDKTAKSFQKLGVNSGDIVTFLVVNTPETIYSFYALNKIGAISNMIDPRSNAKGLEKYLNEVNSKVLVGLDVCYSNIKGALSNTNVQKVVYFSAINSIPFGLKLSANLIEKIKKMNEKTETIPENSIFQSWNKFISNGQDVQKVEIFKYQKDYPAVIVHTGGTTGIPKGVLLSNDNLNAVTTQVKNCPINLKEGEKFLNILVPFVAYGLALGMHAPMSLGWDSILIPKFEPSDIIKLMKKHKPAAVMGIQTYYEPLLNYNNYNYKSTKAMLMGGMPTKSEFEKNMNSKIKDNNGNFEISKGYSMTEASSCATCSFNNANEIGSNGVPLIKTNVAAFDPVTGKEVGYNKPGEICLLTPTRMLKYYNNEAETSNVIKMHSDGNLWIHSGDIGYITENGFVYIIDRIKRMIIRSGFKVFPSEIENVFLKHPSVEACAVVATNDIVDNKAPKAHIVLKSEFLGQEEKIKEELSKYITENGLPPYFTPVEYVFRDSLPLTNIGKVDFVNLEKEENNKINIKK